MPPHVPEGLRSRGAAAVGTFEVTDSSPEALAEKQAGCETFPSLFLYCSMEEKKKKQLT
jgi:hypothetical protein